ncbi:CAP domain-containing protein [Brevundimonas aveniformis]|uniref:CAP domain-containing protein n=1 Tax=Brevundimonas aveniformis TaxID=370977 RepID=UPI000405FAD1|nr:CAP domain-containing protein [Brevundimonas aveniformis]
MRAFLIMSAIVSFSTQPTQSYPSSADLVAEINAVRTDPAAYAAHLQVFRNQFEGRVYRTPEGVHVRTQEGVAAVDEAILVLLARSPATALVHDPALDEAAADHVRDQGPAGLRGHTGRDGSSPTERGRRWGASTGVGENIAYGGGSAREVVIQLLVDDGVPDRGHRANTFRDYSSVGAACGPHGVYRQICVIDFGL